MVFDITYMFLFHTLCLLSRCTQPCLYTSVRDYMSLCVYSLVVCDQLPGPPLKQLNAIKGRVRIPSQAHFSMVVRTRGSPLQMAQAWPNVLDELSLSTRRSTPNSSSLAECSETFRHTQSQSCALRSMDVVQYGQHYNYISCEWVLCVCVYHLSFPSYWFFMVFNFQHFNF